MLKNTNTNGTFVVSKPYDEYEKLTLLIDSITVGIIKLNEIANETLEFVQRELQQSDLVFEPEADIKPPTELKSDMVKITHENSPKLSKLLNEVRKEIPNEYKN